MILFYIVWWCLLLISGLDILAFFFIKYECLNKYLKYNIGESTSLELHSEKAMQSNSTKLFYFLNARIYYDIKKIL